MASRRAGRFGYLANRRRSSGASSRMWNGWGGGAGRAAGVAGIGLACSCAAGFALFGSSLLSVSAGGWLSRWTREHATEQLRAELARLDLPKTKRPKDQETKEREGERDILGQWAPRALVLGRRRLADAAQRAALGRWRLWFRHVGLCVGSDSTVSRGTALYSALHGRGSVVCCGRCIRRPLCWRAVGGQLLCRRRRPRSCRCRLPIPLFCRQNPHVSADGVLGAARLACCSGCVVKKATRFATGDRKPCAFFYYS